MVTVDNPGNANTTASTGPPSIEGGMRFRQVLGQALRAGSTGPPSIEGGMQIVERGLIGVPSGFNGAALN